jgi:aerobic C4-dicarboxylate transport protein
MAAAAALEGARAESTPLYKSFFADVLAALILGVILGVAMPDCAISLKMWWM